jgi:hypothetical protein
MPALQLHHSVTAGSIVLQDQDGVWRLEIPAGPQGHYRLAQLDDYKGRRRDSFPWQPPVHLQLRARASHPEIPGTWGFGLWNDPFGMAVVRGAEMLRLPTLPNAAWFFIASPPNALTLRDDLPANGALATTFRAPHLPGLLLALGAPSLPLLWVKPTRRPLRRIGSQVVRQSAVHLDHDLTAWHRYEVAWSPDGVRLSVDGQAVLETVVAPLGPLGLVLWVDNQYAALPPDRSPSFGSLANPEPAWVEIGDLEVL